MSKDEKKYTRLVHSKISGYNMYYFPETLSGTMDTALHIPSDELVNVVPLTRFESVTEDVVEWFRDMFMKPMLHEFFEWPVDLVVMEFQPKAASKKAVVQKSYVPFLIFDKRAYPKMVPLKKFLYQSNDNEILDWRRPETFEFCCTILRALDTLDRHGYAYHDFDIERIFYDETTGKILFRYSHQIRKKDGTDELDLVNPNELAWKFTPSYIYDENKFDGILKPDADYYQIAALLFRLMIGKLPYQGKEMISFGEVFNPDVDIDEETYFSNYHAYPHFIFDPNDATNCLGPSWENDLPKERWEKLPEKMRKMFYHALCQKTAEGYNMEPLPTPGEWLAELTKLNVTNEMRENHVE